MINDSEISVLKLKEDIPCPVLGMIVRSLKINNVSLSASVQDIKEFFSFSGDIEHVELQRADEWSQIAYVTFRDSQGAETTLLLSGATIVDLFVIVTPAPEYQVPTVVSAPLHNEAKATSGSGSVIPKAEDVVTSMLAKGWAKMLSTKQKLSMRSTASHPLLLLELLPLTRKSD